MKFLYTACTRVHYNTNVHVHVHYTLYDHSNPLPIPLSTQIHPAFLPPSFPPLSPCLPQAQEKEKVNEGHIARLQSTIERMLKESNERMKTHSAERKALASEKVGVVSREHHMTIMILV